MVELDVVTTPSAEWDGVMLVRRAEPHRCQLMPIVRLSGDIGN